MATKTQITLIDDTDGTPADETIQFSLDGVTYEIDLTQAHAEALRESFGRFLDAARRTGGRSTRTASTRPAAKPDEVTREDRENMREWARRNGWPSLGSRGRVPDEVVQRWNDAGRPVV